MRAVQSHAYCKNDTYARKLLNGVDHCGTAGNEAVNCNNMKINIIFMSMEFIILCCLPCQIYVPLIVILTVNSSSYTPEI